MLPHPKDVVLDDPRPSEDPRPSKDPRPNDVPPPVDVSVSTGRKKESEVLPSLNDPFGHISEVKGISFNYTSNIYMKFKKFKKLNINLGHSEFIQMLVNAKAVASMNGKSVRVHWRGHYTSVKPNEPPFTSDDLRMRLSKALLDIRLPTDEEREVHLFLLNRYATEYISNSYLQFYRTKKLSDTSQLNSSGCGSMNSSVDSCIDLNGIAPPIVPPIVAPAIAPPIVPPIVASPAVGPAAITTIHEKEVPSPPTRIQNFMPPPTRAKSVNMSYGKKMKKKTCSATTNSVPKKHVSPANAPVSKDEPMPETNTRTVHDMDGPSLGKGVGKKGRPKTFTMQMIEDIDAKLLCYERQLQDRVI